MNCFNDKQEHVFNQFQILNRDAMFSDKSCHIKLAFNKHDSEYERKPEPFHQQHTISLGEVIMKNITLLPNIH
jgi:hypothetical protein